MQIRMVLNGALRWSAAPAAVPVQKAAALTEYPSALDFYFANLTIMSSLFHKARGIRRDREAVPIPEMTAFHAGVPSDTVWIR